MSLCTGVKNCARISFSGIIKTHLSMLIILQKFVLNEQKQNLIIRELGAPQLCFSDWPADSFSCKKLHHKNNNCV